MTTPLTKLCNRCFIDKPEEEFYKRKASKEARRKYCHVCQRAEEKRRYAEEPDKYRERKQRSRDNNIKGSLLISARARAKRMNISFLITEEDIEIPELCPCFGVPLKASRRASSANSPSIDRIINAKWYVPGNVQVISLKANTMKSNATPEELLLFARWILKTYTGDDDNVDNN